MKLLLWAVIAALIVAWIMREKKTSGTMRDARQDAARATRSLGEPQQMVQCAECGLYLPASEAIAGPSGKVFCGEEHRLQHAAR